MARINDSTNIKKFETRRKQRATILKMEQIAVGGTFQEWFFEVEDEDGEVYQWYDKTLSAKATKAQCKLAIGQHLLNNENVKPAHTAITKTTITGKGTGETVG